MDLDWESIFHSISDSVVITDAHGHCLWANKATLALAGASSFEDLRTRGYSVCDRVMSSLPREGAKNLPLHFTNLAGHQKEILVSFSPVSGAEDPNRYVFISRDVTDLKGYERQRQQLMQVVSHELKNPLQAMKGLVQLSRIKIGLDMDKLRNYIDLLDGHVSRVATLVDDILTAYRIGDGGLELRIDIVNMSDIIKEVIVPYSHRSDRHLIVVNPYTNLSVKADARRLGQVLSNLLTNAWKHTPAGKRIWLRTALLEDSLLVRVEDEGQGIPSDKIDRIFDGFSRPDSVAEWKSGGAGVGLYVGRNIIRRHGGDLWAETRPGNGTIMTMRLPLHGQLTLPSTAG